MSIARRCGFVPQLSAILSAEKQPTTTDCGFRARIGAGGVVSFRIGCILRPDAAKRQYLQPPAAQPGIAVDRVARKIVCILRAPPSARQLNAKPLGRSKLVTPRSLVLCLL